MNVEHNNFNKKIANYEKGYHLEQALDRDLNKLSRKLEKAGYLYLNSRNYEKGDFEIIFGNYKENQKYYRMIFSSKENPNTGTNNDHIKNEIRLERLLDFNEENESYKKIENIFTESIDGLQKSYYKKIVKLYNNQKTDEMPKIKNYDANKLLLYSIAAGYGATVVSAVDNTNLVNNAYYGFLHLAMLFGPFIPLQISKKTRSISQLVSLGLVTWVANSISYYPIGILMGHTANNLTDMINWYKFQLGMGSGSYIDKYGPISVKISSNAKAISYAGRLGLAGILSQFDKIKEKIKGKMEVDENGKN